jgi:hypothetical protein
MRPFANELSLVDFKRIGLEEPKSAGKLVPEFLERRQAAPIPLDRGNEGTGIEERASEASGPWPDFVDALPVEIARNRRDPRQ